MGSCVSQCSSGTLRERKRRIDVKAKGDAKRNFDDVELQERLAEVSKDSALKNESLHCKEFDGDSFSPLFKFPDGKYSRRTSFFQGGQRSLDGQIITFLSKKSCIFDSSRRSTPLHEPMFAQSCPVLCDSVSITSKATQTEVLHENAAVFHMSGDHMHRVPFHSTEDRHKSTPLWAGSKGDQKASECASASELFTRNVSCEECGADCEFLSAQVPRHRTNSFLSAVRSGSSNIFEALLNAESEGTERRDKRFAPLSISKETSQSSSENEELLCLKPMKSVKIAEHRQQQYNFQPISQKTSTPTESERSSATTDVNVDSTRDTAREKSFKTSQRSLRRGSGANSPNSVTGIPRCKAFDFSEQDDYHSMPSPTVKQVVTFEKVEKRVEQSVPDVRGEETNNKVVFQQKTFTYNRENVSRRFETGKTTMLIPEVMENSETESAKGSFECEAPELPVPDPISSLPVAGSAFPNLPNTVLSKLGVSKDTGPTTDLLCDQELENKFLSLALAFNTDKLTLPKRLEIQKHLRDIAERDMENEIKAIKDSLNYLSFNTNCSETRDLILSLQNHVDVISSATVNVSARSETYGAVQQEERISGAFQIMLLHVENLKRMFDREHRELEETKQLLTSTRVPGREPLVTEIGGSVPEHRRSFKTLGMAVGTIKSVVRRASVAEFHHLSSGKTSSWNTAVKAETESGLFKVLAPYSSSRTLTMSSNSSSVPLCSPYSWSTNQVRGRRRSLSITPSSDSAMPFSSNVTKIPSKDLLSINKCSKESKASMFSSLTPVVDEELSDTEINQEETNDNIWDMADSPQSRPVWDQHDDSSKKEIDTTVYRTFYDTLYDVVKETTEYSADSKTTKPAFLGRLNSSPLVQILKTTSTKNLLRYSISMLLAIMAIVVLLNVFIMDVDDKQSHCGLNGAFGSLIHSSPGRQTV